MSPIPEQILRTPRGGILYDASRLRKPADELFEREHWHSRGALQDMVGGRGSVSVLQAEGQRWVLRHYRRGGWAAKLSADRYVWLGESRTRSFAEWRLLAQLRGLGLPVPAPVAARYVRDAFTYRADLITEQLPETRTLADCITGVALPAEHWRAIGATVSAFHRNGVHHADLNANNILLGPVPEGGADPAVYLLDFDRGRIRERGAWEADVLARLRRSLDKISRLREGVVFGEGEWQQLLRGYEGR